MEKEIAELVQADLEAVELFIHYFEVAIWTVFFVVIARATFHLLKGVVKFFTEFARNVRDDEAA